MGKRGGCKPCFTKLARSGGKATVKKYGKAHMRRIGRAGGKASAKGRK